MSEDEKKTDVVEQYQEENDSRLEEVVASVDSTKTSPGVQGWFKKLYKWIEVDGTEGASLSQLFLYNNDLRPLEEARRTWKWWNYVNFWISESFNINAWQIAATGVEAGLSWYVTWITVWLGYFFCGSFLVLAARYGSYNHVSFPVATRSSWGIWGSLWPVLNRVVMACIWFGVQSVLGGQCVQLMLKAIFGNDLDTRIHNTIGGTVIDSFGVLSFFLYWLSQLPAIYMKPHTVRHLFTAKAILCPIAGIAFLVWTLVKAHGAGPAIHKGSDISGSAFGWAFVNSTMNCISNFATLIINAPDFSRMAAKGNSPLWSQFIAVPVTFGITCLIGILVTSASAYIYNESFWDPLDVLGKFLEGNSRGDRGGVFLLALCFAIAQMGTNISANSLSAGTDMTALLPKFINIRRGSFICAAIGFAICPWNLMSSSNKFTTYLSAYAVFLSSMAGIYFCDYYIIRKGHIILEDLYIANKSSVYYYTYGVNWRAVVAYLCGVAPNITGFVGATGTHHVPDGATKVYYLSFFVGYISAAAVYLILNMLSPVRGTPDGPIFEKKWLEEWKEVEDFDVFFRNQMKRSETAQSEGDKVLQSSSQSDEA